MTAANNHPIPGSALPGRMKAFRATMLVLAVAQAAFVGLTALVGAFADGGDAWSRLLLALVHPLSAAGLLLLALSPRPAATFTYAVAALLALAVAADVVFAALIAQGAVKGDWILPLIFAAVPAVGIVYALMLAALRPASNLR